MYKLATLITVSLLTAIAVIRPAIAESPEQIEERRAIDVVELIGAGDAEDLLAFMHENWIPAKPKSDRDDRWPRIAKTLTERHAGLEIVGVLADREHQLTIVTEDPDGTKLRFIFDFEAEPPYKVAGMGIEAGEPRGGPELPPCEIPAEADLEQIAIALQEWFDNLAEQAIFSGTALLAWKGETVFSGAWGLASIKWNVPNKLDTRFDLGSINKSFTKIAVGQLMHQGMLKLDDKIADHLPDYSNTEAADKITIRHLIDHNSGLGDIFTDEFFKSSKSLYRSPSDFFPLFADKPLLFEPGTRSEYSNAGFMVLGAIIESVSGMPYDQYVMENIFKPARMNSSGFFAHDEPVPNIAVGYTRMMAEGESDQLRSNMLMLPVKGNSAGSAQSTVEDLQRFDNAVRDHKLLPPVYTDWYFNGGDPLPESEVSSDRVVTTIGIAGGAPGVSATLQSDGEIAIIVLSNFDAPITESVARGLFLPVKKALVNM